MASCNGCNRTFSSTLALQDHQRSTGHIDSPKSHTPPIASHKCHHCNINFFYKAQLTNHNQSCHRYTCPICQRQFAELEHLQQHQGSLKHYLHCAVCDLPFANAEDRDEHRRASHMLACDACEELFENTKDLRAHQHARGHCYCRECEQDFKDHVTYQQHMQSKIHVSQYRCLDCKKDFVNEKALTQHLEDKVHKPPRDPGIDQSDYTCSKCNRTFRRPEDLQNHLQSLAHKPLSNLKCILSSKCKATFKSPSGLIQHLESGACHSGMTKANLDSLILQHDINNEITMGSKTLSLAARPAVTQPSPWPPHLNLLLPNLHNAIKTPNPPQTTHFTFASHAEKESFIQTALPILNSKGQLTCPLCPNKTRTFHSMQAFRNHIESPAHDAKVYHCPVDVLPPTHNNNNNNNNGKEKETGVLMKEFSALSAVTQHVESGACKGGRKMLEVAIGSVEERLRELGFKGVRLLK